MKKKPIIGITSYPPGETHGFHIPKFYVESVLRSGGTPVILPSSGKDSIPEWISILDGVILSGGGDLDPVHYGGESHTTIYNLNPLRDETELALAKTILELKIPTFCICRGLQILNVVLGGTLYPHLPDKYGESVLHRAPPREPIPHEVKIERSSRLYEIFKKESIHSVSWHHQSIREAGRGVRVVGWAPDGVVEAIEVPENPQILAVQWHPELGGAEDENAEKLFKEFVAMCGH